PPPPGARFPISRTAGFRGFATDGPLTGTGNSKNLAGQRRSCQRSDRSGRAVDFGGSVVEIETEPAAGRRVQVEKAVRERRAVTAGPRLDAPPAQRLSQRDRIPSCDVEGDERGAAARVGRAVDPQPGYSRERGERALGERARVVRDLVHGVANVATLERAGLPEIP